MVEENLTDEQQAEIARNWFKENGGFILGGVVVAVGGLFGWQQWQNYQQTQAEEASVLYEDLLAAAYSRNPAQAGDIFGDLESNYSGSGYNDLAHFVLAKSFMDQTDFEAAVEHLGAIVDQTDSAEFRQIATLRLARVRLQQQQFDAALEVIGISNPNSSFTPGFDEVRGDIYYAQERFDEARTSYEAALSSPQQPPVIDRIYVQAKLDALGGARAGDVTIE